MCWHRRRWTCTFLFHVDRPKNDRTDLLQKPWSYSFNSVKLSSLWSLTVLVAEHHFPDRLAHAELQSTFIQYKPTRTINTTIFTFYSNNTDTFALKCSAEYLRIQWAVQSQLYFDSALTNWCNDNSRNVLLILRFTWVSATLSPTANHGTYAATTNNQQIKLHKEALQQNNRCQSEAKMSLWPS